MLLKESSVIRELLLSLQISEKNVILNIGSQNSEYLKRNPAVKKNIFDFIQLTGSTLINFDLFEGEGVDISGDIYDDEVFDELKSLSPDIILLNNVLEHVIEIPRFAGRVQQIVKKHGYVIFSGPFKYPEHLDPIDNLFRPDPDALVPLFNCCILVHSEIIQDVTYLQNITRDKRIFLLEFLRILAPFYKFRKWRRIVLPKLKYLFTHFEVSIAMFKKISD